MAEERLQKIMAAAGIGSRRACEKLIEQGHVQVDGQTVTELGTKVDAEEVQISVRGKPIQIPARHVYLKLNKPRNYLSDFGGNPRGRKTVADLLPKELRRVFSVGRLDLRSEGLILLTDDGDLAHRLTHPRFEHPKVYFALVGERPTEQALETLRSGVKLAQGQTAPADVQIAPSLPATLQLEKGPVRGVWLRIVLREGKKRQIRHMTAAVGHPTLRLIRWAIGPLELGNLAPGQWTYLPRADVTALRHAVESQSRRPRTGRKDRVTHRDSKRRRSSRKHRSAR